MIPTEKPEGDARMRLANQYETFLRSMVLLRGDHLSGEQLGQIVERAVASASPEERRNPVPSTDAINRLQQFLIQITEAGRPHNVFSAEAARAAQAAGGADGLRGAGFGTLDAVRAGSSARFRELAAREGSDGGKGGSAITASSGGVTVEFARSFAGRRLALRRVHAAERGGTEDWLSRHFAMLLQVDAERGMLELVVWLDRSAAPVGAGSGRVLAEENDEDVEAGRRQSTTAERVLGTLFGREDRLHCSRAIKTANVDVLTSLIRLAYRHIRPQDDIEHEGSYTPGQRDASQEARNVILGALLDRSGADAYLAVRELAVDPLFEARWHRFNELAHGMAERDAELPAWSPLEVFHFERNSVAPAKTGDALLKVVMGVLLDINADLTGAGSDSSSRALLQRAEVEEEVQQWLAEQMNLRAMGRFHAHREAQVADGDKPDIVVSSTASSYEVALEIKHGGQGWSIRDLESALTWQLAENYLKPVNRRHGVLVISYHGKRSWRAPEDRAVLSFEDVMIRLKKKAEGQTANRAGAVALRAIGIDASCTPDLRHRNRP